MAKIDFSSKNSGKIDRKSPTFDSRTKAGLTSQADIPSTEDEKRCEGDRWTVHIDEVHQSRRISQVIDVHPIGQVIIHGLAEDGPLFRRNGKKDEHFRVFDTQPAVPGSRFAGPALTVVARVRDLLLVERDPATARVLQEGPSAYHHHQADDDDPETHYSDDNETDDDDDEEAYDDDEEAHDDDDETYDDDHAVHNQHGAARRRGDHRFGYRDYGQETKTQA